MSVKNFGWKRISAVGALALLAFASFSAWAVSSPVGSSPDDDFHLVSIWCGLGEREGLCESTEDSTERLVQTRLVEAHQCYAARPAENGDCGLSDQDYTETSRGNFTGGYPPVYYAALSIFASPDISASTIVMRLFNSALFVGVVTTLLLLLGRGRRGPLLWSLVVGMVPLGMFIVPSLNPSSWSVLVIATLWVALIGYFSASQRTRRIAFGVLATILAVMGAGSRGDTAAFVAFSAIVACVLSFRHDRTWWRLTVLPAAIVLIGTYFFLTSGQSTGITGISGEQEAAAQSVGSSLRHAVDELQKLPFLIGGVSGLWGLGWLDTHLPALVPGILIVLFAGVAFWGMRVLNWKKSTAMALTAFAIACMPMYVYIREGISVGEGVQPRYILPLVILFAGLAAYGARHDHLGLNRAQAGIVLFGVAVANSISLFYNLRRYITGLDYSGLNLDSNIEWWWSTPISPMMVWLGGSAAFTMLLAGLFLTMYRGDGQTGPPVPSAPQVSTTILDDNGDRDVVSPASNVGPPNSIVQR